MLPLMVREVASDTAVNLLREDGGAVVWWRTWAECAVAISRLRREDRLDEEGEEEARARLDLLTSSWRQIRPTDDLRLLAVLLSRSHPLKTAALRWREGDTSDTGFVCLDERLRRAAEDEGFCVLPTPPDEEGDP